MNTLRERLETLIQGKQQVSVNFPAGAGTKLISASGTITSVGQDYFMLLDIYGNSMVVPFASVAYVEIKK